MSRVVVAVGMVVGALAAVGAGAAAAALGSRRWVVRRTDAQVVRAGSERLSPAPVPVPVPVPAAVAAVLGAGLRPDGSVTALLARRVEAGVDLYHFGAVATLVMSGAVVGSQDEPAAMARHARSLGVPAEAIMLDRRGVNTAATCRELAGGLAPPGAPVVLVTQEFHIHRALYLAGKAGLNATGYATPDADVRPAALTRARLRELPAAAKAVFVDRPRA